MLHNELRASHLKMSINRPLVFFTRKHVVAVTLPTMLEMLTMEPLPTFFSIMSLLTALVTRKGPWGSQNTSTHQCHTTKHRRLNMAPSNTTTTAACVPTTNATISREIFTSDNTVHLQSGLFLMDCSISNISCYGPCNILPVLQEMLQLWGKSKNHTDG